MDKEFENALVVEFPLRGEWMSPNTPGKRIPSHGTDKFGQRYAFDFFQVDSRKIFFKGNQLKYFFYKIPLSDCYCWGKDVFAPCDGKIIEAMDGYKERQTLQFFKDFFAIIKNSRNYDPEKHGIQAVAGNYVIMECSENKYAFFAHFKTDSISVKSGEFIKKGHILGKVGHTGNSTAPHLHFHIMDNINPIIAKGIPCVFEQYEKFYGNAWEKIENGIPSDKDIIRFNG